MVKKVVRKDQVTHLWAAQTQDEARSHNGNQSFAGRVLFSYSTPIASLVDSASGLVALITSHHYSVTTTGKHMPSVADVSQYPAFHVPNLFPNGGFTPYLGQHVEAPQGERHAGNLAHFLSSYVAQMEVAKRKRDLPDWASADVHLRVNSYGSPEIYLREYRRYARVFGISFAESSLPCYGADCEDLRKHFALKATKALARLSPAERARREAAKAKRAVDAAEAQRLRWADLETRHAAWLTGAKTQGRAVDDTGSAYVRVVGDTVETSRGAVVPLKAGLCLISLAKRCLDTGTPWNRPMRIGSFHLTEITADGTATVGCHALSWAQMEAAAQRAGIPIPSTVACNEAEA